jgi:hypothetical protein
MYYSNDKILSILARDTVRVPDSFTVYTHCDEIYVSQHGSTSSDFIFWLGVEYDSYALAAILARKIDTANMLVIGREDGIPGLCITRDLGLYCTIAQGCYEHGHIYSANGAF